MSIEDDGPDSNCVPQEIDDIQPMVVGVYAVPCDQVDTECVYQAYGHTKKYCFFRGFAFTHLNHLL